MGNSLQDGAVLSVSGIIHHVKLLGDLVVSSGSEVVPYFPAISQETCDKTRSSVFQHALLQDQ